MTQALGWVFAVICAVCAPVLIVLSFVMPDSAAAGGIRISLAQFLIPVVLSWIALFPRSTREWQTLRKGHPLAQRHFGGKPAGFFGDYRRKLTRLGKVLLYGTIGLFAVSLLMGAVHAELFIIGFLFLVALSSWIMRLESDGDKTAAVIRQIASALVYRRVLPPRALS